MGHPQQLLLITQPKAAGSNALLHALKLTESLRATLRIVSFVHSETVDVVGMINHDGRDKARQNMMDLHRLWVQSETSQLREKGYDVQHEAVWEKRTAKAMADYIAHHAPDLVIKDLHEESTLKRMVSSSPDWELLSASCSSILFIKDVPDRWPLKYIAAVDFGQTDEDDQVRVMRDRIISTAYDLALACSGALHLISVYDRSELDGGLLNEALDIGDIPTAGAREIIFDECCEAHGVARAHRHFLIGAPAQTLHGYIERNGCEMLVMGAMHSSGSIGAVRSTAEQVLGKPACSVLMVKPDLSTSTYMLKTEQLLRGYEGA